MRLRVGGYVLFGRYTFTPVSACACVLSNSLILCLDMKIVELKRVPKNRFGRVITNDVCLEAHEYSTLYFLSSFGLCIEVIKPSNTPGTRSADYLINGAIWEGKSPDGSGNSTISRQFHKASRQADRLILDLRRVKIPKDKAKREALNRLEKSRNIKRMLLITKDGQLLDVKR